MTSTFHLKRDQIALMRPLVFGRHVEYVSQVKNLGGFVPERSSYEQDGRDMYDTLIAGGHLLTMSGEGVGFLENGAVAIDHGEIVAVDTAEALEAKGTPRERIDSSGCIVMPGLVDAHLHSAATTGRGWAQEISPWMASGYGPLMRHAIEADAPLWTLLALMEGVANGTTTFGDYESPMNELIHSHIAIGSRAVVCEGVSELNWANREQWLADGWTPGEPTPLDRAMGERTLANEIALYERWNGHDDGRIRVIFGPHAADFLSKEMLLRVQEEARKRNAALHLHTAQDARENKATEQRYGLRAVPYLDSIGLLGSDLIAVHLSVTTDDEVDLVARRGARMICCANSIGIIDGVLPPARRFIDGGGVVGYGTDQSPGNNSHNIFSEMRANAMFAKIKAEDPLVMPAWQVLRAATIGGATALGVGGVTGSLEVGKAADLIMVDTTRPPMSPLLLSPARNIVPNLVYGETGANVVLNMVAGRVIYRNGHFTRIDEAETKLAVAAATKRFTDSVSADATVNELPIVQLTRNGFH
jgi:5-methylthioadenosine/S-adenosylhomocysteine deaminase